MSRHLRAREHGQRHVLQTPPAPEAVARTAALDERLVSLVAPHSYEAEQYRSLRHLVEQAHRTSALSVLAVSSATVGDGKTTTAINLAGALAQAADARVLLMDVDLRRPAIAERLALPQERDGLVDAILSPDRKLADVARPCGLLNLAIVTAGAFSDIPYELLRSPRLGDLLDQARRDYDYVVLDTPPLVPIPDARVISKWVDSFLLVVRANKTPRGLLEESLNLMDPQKVIGLVFNNDDRARTTYENYYAGSPDEVGSKAWWRPFARIRTVLGSDAPRRRHHGRRGEIR